MIVTVKSSAFQPGQPIPRKYTGEGQDLSPPLEWEVPMGTKEIAVVCDDPDASRPTPWLHWLIYGIPGDVKGLPEGIPKQYKTVATPIRACQGMNNYNVVGYCGPLPPRGHGLHHYHFKVLALKEPMNLFCGATLERFKLALRGRILAEGVLIGTYERK